MRAAFANVPLPENARKPLGEELSREVFRHIRRLSNEDIPFFLSEILVEICYEPDRDIINNIIELLDFNLSATMSDSEHKEIWGEEDLEEYKQTKQIHLKNNTQITSLLSKARASSILYWLNWVKKVEILIGGEMTSLKGQFSIGRLEVMRTLIVIRFRNRPENTLHPSHLDFVCSTWLFHKKMNSP